MAVVDLGEIMPERLLREKYRMPRPVRQGGRALVTLRQTWSHGHPSSWLVGVAEGRRGVPAPGRPACVLGRTLWVYSSRTFVRCEELLYVNVRYIGELAFL
jgi:hypothetical protein